MRRGPTHEVAEYRRQSIWHLLTAIQLLINRIKRNDILAFSFNVMARLSYGYMCNFCMRANMLLNCLLQFLHTRIAHVTIALFVVHSLSSTK